MFQCYQATQVVRTDGVQRLESDSNLINYFDSIFPTPTANVQLLPTVGMRLVIMYRAGGGF